MFTDADLAILGKDATTYMNYSHQIRQEYKVYPDFMYNPRRKNVLHHFLQMESIYKTPQFRQQYDCLVETARWVSETVIAPKIMAISQNPRNMKNITLAISAAPCAITGKPNMTAMMAIIKKVAVHFNIT